MATADVHTKSPLVAQDVATLKHESLTLGMPQLLPPRGVAMQLPKQFLTGCKL